MLHDTSAIWADLNPSKDRKIYVPDVASRAELKLELPTRSGSWRQRLCRKSSSFARAEAAPAAAAGATAARGDWSGSHVHPPALLGSRARPGAAAKQDCVHVERPQRW